MGENVPVKRKSRIAERRIKLEGNVTYDEWKNRYVLPKSAIESIKLEPKTLEEAQKCAERMNKLVGKYVTRPSKWNGKVIESAEGYSYKHPACFIGVYLKDCPDDAILHEMLHSCSISYYSPEIYFENQAIEEATVELLAEEIAKREQIELAKSGYDDWVNLLREFNQEIKVYDSDLAFAIALFEETPEERVAWLNEKALEFVNTKSGSMGDFFDLIKPLESLR